MIKFYICLNLNYFKIFIKIKHFIMQESTRNNSHSFKIKYFTCDQGEEHEDEVLNFVCIDKHCSKKGLVCSICKSETHKGHSIIPLKILLEKLKYHHQKPMQSQNFQDHIGNIQDLKAKILYELRLCVQQFANRFRSLQQKIIEQFSQTKIELLEQIQLNMKFQQIIRNALTNQINDKNLFQQDMSRIASLVQSTSGSDINFEINLTKIVSQYSKKIDQVSVLLEHVQKDIAIKLKLGNTNMFELPKLQNIFEEKIEPSVKQISYTFSNVYKGNSLQITKNNKLAIQTDTVSTRFVFVNEGLGLKSQKIKFHIKKLKNWIGVGIGLRNVLSKCNYSFNYNTLGHGSYLVSYNGYTWSHSQSSQNVVALKDFSFVQGDTLQLVLNNNVMTITRMKDKKSTKMNVNLKQQQWLQACFCINLCTKEDSVEIID